MANFNFNKVILGGRLTADPELKTTPNGIVVTSFSIAVNRRPSKSSDGQANQQSDFFNCTAWRSTAEFITRYFRKGSSICITGTLQNRSWNDPQGNKRYATDIVVDEVNFVDSKGDNTQYQSSSDNFGAPSYSTEATPDFEVISGDQDLPF
ncbi:MAG: single-stranded DNA-binding protein [Ruminococcaceae bacterium]|nr:single-stranded DNA-binding protein [Oscillospiraceae bacterium]